MKSSYSPNYQNQSGNDTSNKPDFAPASNHFYSQKEAIQASFRDTKHFLNLDDVNKNTVHITNDFTPIPYPKMRHNLFSFFMEAMHKKHRGLSPYQIYETNSYNQVPQEFYNEKEIDIQKYELAINDAQDDQAARHVICGLLTKHKSLWDPVTQDENAFTNVLLSSLRHNSIETYRAIVEEQYLKHLGVEFQKGETTLYRGDTRDYNIIFNEGFKLWPVENASGINKAMYAWNNGRIGVSLSKSASIASGHGQYNGFYTIKLPVNHQLLLIPFKTCYLREVNSMDGIPTQYIESFQRNNNSNRFFLFNKFETIKNPNYDENAIVAPTVRRGCY